MGNTRAVVTPSSSGGSAYVLQQTHYYPFGMRMSEISTSSGSSNKYLYNGKELQTDFGLNWYDYGARFYDPALGRWTTPDPLCETFQEAYTPYHYCLNNPVLHTDPDGRILPVLAVMAIKGVVAGVIDAGTQVAVGMAMGQNLSEAVGNIDYVSVGSSALMGALSVPGIGTTVKTTAAVVTTVVDAAVDYTSEGPKYVGGDGDHNKPVINAVTDAAFSVAGNLKADTHIPFTSGGTKTEIKAADLLKPATEKQVSSTLSSGDVVQTIQGSTFGNNGIINKGVQNAIEEKDNDKK